MIVFPPLFLKFGREFETVVAKELVGDKNLVIVTD